MPARPLSPYAVTKHVGELYGFVFNDLFGLETIGLRYFNVFGPRQDPRSQYAAVIPKWIAAMIKNEPVYINGDGETSRDFCYIDNAVQANLLATTSTTVKTGFCVLWRKTARPAQEFPPGESARSTSRRHSAPPCSKACRAGVWWSWRRRAAGSGRVR